LPKVKDTLQHAKGERYIIAAVGDAGQRSWRF
jgi:hypothetical protein